MRQPLTLISPTLAIQPQPSIQLTRRLDVCTCASERWGFIVQANRLARVCLEEATRYATKRNTFGKKLIDHQVQ